MRENSSSTTAWWQWSSWFSGRASLSTTEEEEEELEEERAAPGQGCGCPPTPPLYIGARERGAGPLDPIWWEGRRPGRVACPPSQGGAPSRVSPNPRRMGPRGVWRPAHLGAGSPLYSAHRALRGRWTLPVDPRNPFGGPGTIPVTPRTLRVTE